MRPMNNSKNKLNSKISWHLVYRFKTLVETFCVVTFSHTHIQCNFVVHNLAKHARHVRCLLKWKEDVPSHLLSVTLADFG